MPNIDKEKRKEYNKAYYQAHREEMKAQMKAWGQEHKEERKAYFKAYRDSHKEERKESYKKYRETHKEKIRKVQKASYQAHKVERLAYRKEYRKTHKEETNYYQNNYRKISINSSGVKKASIRCMSNQYLFNTLKHHKLKGYEIHHCFGYDDYRNFIYIPKSLHLKIHQYLRDNGIDADTDHYDKIVHLIIACEEYVYIKA